MIRLATLCLLVLSTTISPRGDSGQIICGPGTFPDSWIHGAPNCATSVDPPLQVHAFNESTYIIRQSKCTSPNAPFLYLLLGQERALLVDSGATADPAVFPIKPAIDRILRKWKQAQGITQYELVVTHTHEHGDHFLADAQFVGQASTTVVGVTQQDLQAFYGMGSWPTDVGSIDLGGRIVDVIATPGHSPGSVSYYDRCADLLLTGDTLLPGYLLIFDSQSDYVASIERLFNFALVNPVEYILGGHIEMTAVPGVPFPGGATYQPNEHPLALDIAHLRELHKALQLMGLPLIPWQFNDFHLSPF